MLRYYTSGGDLNISNLKEKIVLLFILINKYHLLKLLDAIRYICLKPVASLL